MIGLKRNNRKSRSASPPQKRQSSYNFLFPMMRGGEQDPEQEHEEQRLPASPISYFLAKNPQYINNNDEYVFSPKSKTRQARMDLTV
mmetsp:Transcript_21995/g.32489  ORF Transcript_21995/g.32489 Transcript_21995/m.32489 type:complete len:87 (+) Transcript_21995:24-284(+)